MSWHNPGPSVIGVVTSNCKTSPGNNNLSTQPSNPKVVILFNALNYLQAHIITISLDYHYIVENVALLTAVSTNKESTMQASELLVRPFSSQGAHRLEVISAHIFENHNI